MPAYIPVPFASEPTEIAADSFDYIETQVPGWLPSPGNLEAWLIESQALIAGELRTLIAQVPEAIFDYFGGTVLGLPANSATSATALTTWTTRDAAGYTIPAGTLFALTPTAGTVAYTFALDVDLVIPAGSTVAAGVGGTALEAGAAASGLTGTIAALDPLDFVLSVTLDAPTSGGSDAEAADVYRNRLSALLTLLTPRPILAPDFALLVQSLVPGVSRAVAIDLYNADTDETGVPRCVTVAIADSSGEPNSAETKAEADALLQAMREVNFLAFITDPDYTTIDVTYTVVYYPGGDPADVVSRTNAALASYLDPANWGLPPFGDTTGRNWLNETEVRYLEVAEQINRVGGVHYIDSLSIGIHGGAMGTADLVLTGAAPLTRAGTIGGTALPPS